MLPPSTLWLPLHHVTRLDPYADPVPTPTDVARRAREADERRSRINKSQRVIHAITLHPDLPGVKGKVSLMKASPQLDGQIRWEMRVVSISELPMSDALLWATHISMQRFHGARGSTSLVQLTSLIADIDCHDEAAFRGLSPEKCAGTMIERFRAAGKPLPSYILFSGRGLHLVWVHQPLQATPGITGRHRAVQCHMHGPDGGKPSATVRTPGGTRLQDPRVVAHEETMAAIWRGTGLDRKARDTARVLRLAGSYNWKSGREARLVWPASWTDIVRHDFEDLARAFLPYTRDQMATIKAERQAGYDRREAARLERRADAEAAGLSLPEDPTRRRRAGGGYWPGVVEALDAIRVWWGGTPPEGRRNTWAFLSACAIGMSEGGDAAGWAARLAPLANLPEPEVRASLGTLEHLLRRHEAGETTEYKGVERPKMYAHSKGKMLTLLGLSDADAEAAGAHALLPGGASRVRSERERSAERREAGGAVRREVTVEARVSDGREALAMRAAGKTMAEIVAAFAGRRGETSIRRAMRDATAEVKGVVESVPAPSEDASVSALHGSTTSIVAKPGALAPSTAPARPEPATPPHPEAQGRPPTMPSSRTCTGHGRTLSPALAGSPGLRTAGSRIPPVTVPARPGLDIRAFPATPPLKAQGGPPSRPGLAVDEDEVLPSQAAVPGFPGPPWDGSRLPSEPELPDFLQWVFEGRWPRETLAGT